MHDSSSTPVICTWLTWGVNMGVWWDVISLWNLSYTLCVLFSFSLGWTVWPTIRVTSSSWQIYSFPEGWALKNWCFQTVVLEKTRESSLDQTSQSQRKLILNLHQKDWCWSWNSNTLAIWCKEPTYWKRLWCGERLKAGGKGDDRGWNGWMASLTQWI